MLERTAVSMLMVLGGVAVAQPPQIDSLSSGELPRSGRLRIFGQHFGPAFAPGEVLIGGHSAIVSTWSEMQITAYVPELSGPGAASVQVVTSAGASNAVPLAVTLRQPDGRKKWVFEADAGSLWFRPALASDGTLYVHDTHGRVYALNSDGGLEWIHQVNAFPYVPPEAALGGGVYVGSIQRITAITPEGSEAWRFEDPAAQGIKVGAKAGPDGNVYAAFDFGNGALSLTPQGAFRWNNFGTPVIWWQGGTGAEMVFGPRSSAGPIDQLYIATNYAQAALQAFAVADGSLRFSVPIGGQGDPGAQQQPQPAVGPDGTIYLTHFKGGGNGWVLEAFSPVNGQSLWYRNAWNTSGFSPPDVAPDGVVYYVTSHSRLVAFDPATMTERWNRFDSTLLYRPTVSPANDMIVLGGAIGNGQQNFVRAYSTDGEFRWQFDLPGTSLPRWAPVHRPRFSADGDTVYISTVMLDQNPSDSRAYLFALATGAECYANCDGSTAPPILNVADFGCFLQHFAAGNAYANCDQSTTPPVLNVADFGCFLQKFAAGCQ